MDMDALKPNLTFVLVMECKSRMNTIYSNVKNTLDLKQTLCMEDNAV